MSCSRTQHGDTCEDRTNDLSVRSPTLYHCAIVLPTFWYGVVNIYRLLENFNTDKVIFEGDIETLFYKFINNRTKSKPSFDTIFSYKGPSEAKIQDVLCVYPIIFSAFLARLY